MARPPAGRRGSVRPGAVRLPQPRPSSCSPVFMVVPIGYTVYLSLRRVKVSGLGLGRGARTEVFAGLANYRAVLSPTASSGQRAAGAGLRRAPGAVMLGLALLFALLLDPPQGPAAALLPDRDLPAVRGARRDRQPAVGLPLPAGGQPVPLRCSTSSACRSRTCSARPASTRIANIARLGRHRLQHDRHLHRAAGDPARDVRGGPHRRRYRAADRPADQDPDACAPALMMTDGLLDHRHPPGVQRADHAATADQRHLHDLEPADEGLPGRVRPRRHLLGRRRLGRHRRGHAGPVLRLPAAGPGPGLRAGELQ